MATRREIQFYRTGDQYGEFSNFAAFPIRLKGVEWPTVEHYFQAQKFVGTSHEEELRLAESPMTVARMGRERTRPLRADWEDVKDDIMREAVLTKFEQHADLRNLLPPVTPSSSSTRRTTLTGATAATVRGRTCWAEFSWKCASGSETSFEC